MIGLRLVAAVVFTLVTGLANAQECATGPAPTCNGTCPADFVCAPAQNGTPGCECVAGAALGITKLSIKLSFSATSKDNIGLNALVALPAGFSPDGTTAIVDVGGVIKTFPLNAKGKSKVGADSFSLAKPKNGLAKVSIKFPKGSFASSLADEGLTDTTTVEPVPVSIDVEVTIGGTLYRKSQPQSYTAKQGKSGKTK